MKPFDGRAARAGDHVFESAGMEAGVEDHFGAAQDSLRGEFGGYIAGKAGSNAPVAQALDEEINISRPAAAQSCDGVEERFLELKRKADGRKELLCERAVFRQGRFAERKSGGRSAEQGGRVGHDANQTRPGPQRSFEFGQRNAGSDGDEEMF